MSKAVSFGISGVTPRPRVFANKVSDARRLGEMAYLWMRNGIGPREYTYLGLFRSSIPWREKRNFASTQWYLGQIERINPAEHRIVAWNKIVTHGMLRNFGIPTPVLHGFISPYNGQTVDGRPLRTAVDLADLIDRLSLERACFKLVGGWSGRGFIKVAIERNAEGLAVRIKPDGPRLSVDEFWRQCLTISDETARTVRAKAYGYLCEEELEQHPVLSCFHPESVNTCRIWMSQPEPGVWDMFAAVLRMGTGAASVDNGAPGGIGAVVDIDTGRLHTAVRRGRKGRTFETFTHHPDTGQPIEGTILPQWDGVLPFCRRACSVFPFFQLLALDLVIQRDGYTILEVEADPHSTHQAHFGRGIRPLIESLADKRASAPMR